MEISCPYRRLYIRGTDEYRVFVAAGRLTHHGCLSALRSRSARSLTYGFFQTPPRGSPLPFESRFALVLQAGALASSVSGSLRQGPGSGLALTCAHLRSPGHASHTSGRRPSRPGRLPQNRTCAVRIRLVGTTGCHPRRRPVYDLVVPSGSNSCAGALMAAQTGWNRSRSVTSPRSAKYALRSPRSTAGL